MHGSHRNAWLGLTPEPERELPHAVARLRRRLPGTAPVDRSAIDPESIDPESIDPEPIDPEGERRRMERVILHGTARSWLAYLHEVTELVLTVASRQGPPGRLASGDLQAALLAGEVVLGHHRMLIGLPGPAYEQAAVDRALLGRAVDRLRSQRDKQDKQTGSP